MVQNYILYLKMVSSECSGCSLATLLVTWISAAMIASVLLRWRDMWIALAALTLLFLIICIYAVCTNLFQEARDPLENSTNPDYRTRDIRVCANVHNRSNCCSNMAMEPPAYQPYWIPDLPPSYAMVVGTPEYSIPSLRVGLSEDSRPRMSNPPPYSLVIQPDHTVIHPTAMSQTVIECHHYHHEESPGTVPTHLSTISRRELIPQSPDITDQDKNIVITSELHRQ